MSAVASNNRKVVSFLTREKHLRQMMDILMAGGEGEGASSSPEAAESASKQVLLVAQVFVAEPGVIGDALLDTPTTPPAEGEEGGEGSSSMLFTRLFDMDLSRPLTVAACGVLAALVRRHGPGVREAIQDNMELLTTIARARPTSQPVLALLFELVTDTSSVGWVVQMGVVESLLDALAAPTRALPGGENAACQARDSAVLSLTQWVEWARNPAAYPLREYLLSSPVVHPLVSQTASRHDSIAAAGAVSILSLIKGLVDLTREESMAIVPSAATATATTTSPGVSSTVSSTSPSARSFLDVNPIFTVTETVLPSIVDTLDSILGSHRSQLGLHGYALVQYLSIVFELDPVRAMTLFRPAHVFSTLLALIIQFPLHNCMANYAQKILLGALNDPALVSIAPDVVSESALPTILLRELDPSKAQSSASVCNRGFLLAVATALANSSVPVSEDPDVATSWKAFVAGPLAEAIKTSNASLAGGVGQFRNTAPPLGSLSDSESSISSDDSEASSTMETGETASAGSSATSAATSSAKEGNALLEEYANLRGMGVNDSVLPSGPFVANEIDWGSLESRFEVDPYLQRVQQWEEEPTALLGHLPGALVDPPSPLQDETTEPIAMTLSSKPVVSVWDQTPPPPHGVQDMAISGLAPIFPSSASQLASARANSDLRSKQIYTTLDPQGEGEDDATNVMDFEDMLNMIE